MTLSRRNFNLSPATFVAVDQGEWLMKIFASFLSLTLFAATLSVCFSSPAISQEAKERPKVSKTSAAKPASNVKKPPCDQSGGANHNSPCY